MAGDWIKIQHALPDKPEVVKMAAELGIDQDAVTGKLVRLWIWADQQSVNGNGLSVTETFLDRVTFVTGFAQALRSVGWLEGEDGALSLPNFGRHNGTTAKTRANGQKRTELSRSRNAASVTEPLAKALPEKRREEKSINTIEFEQFWDAYPRRKAKGNAAKAFAKARKKVELEPLLKAVAVYATQMTGKDAQFIAYPATWLNAECWLDETPQSGSGPSSIPDDWEAVKSIVIKVWHPDLRNFDEMAAKLTPEQLEAVKVVGHRKIYFHDDWDKTTPAAYRAARQQVTA